MRVIRRGLAAEAAPSSKAAPASTPSAAPSEKRLHSSDIAFKPTEGGWGFNSSFANGYDRIFSGQAAKPEPPKVQASSAILSAQISALDAALKVGALTSEQYAAAAEGARQRAK